MIVVFTACIAISAFLLFLVQPMAAKKILPVLGGNPSVWNTCMLFYQCMLLLGYGYTHAISRKISWKPQLRLHLVLLALPLLFLPLAVQPHDPPGNDNPIPWLLITLLGSVGLPFFAVSTTGPLLQRWFSRSGHTDAANPYFLYAASNAGSMLALLAYPFLIEPWFTLQAQAWIWSIGYVLFFLLAIGCVLYGLKFTMTAEVLAHTATPPAISIPWLRKLRWIALACIPSSLMLGLNTHLTTDLAPVPLLWVLPLSLYLLTFILVFTSKPIVPGTMVTRTLPLALALFTILSFTSLIKSFPIICAINMLVFFLCCMACHGELARDRPEPEHLTEFYLWLSVGGALGGIFNTLLAPFLFNSVLEYPLAIAAACACLPARVKSPSTTESTVATRTRIWQKPLFKDIAFAYLFFIALVLFKYLSAEYDWSALLTIGLCAFLPAVVIALSGNRSWRLALLMLALIGVSRYRPINTGELLYQHRNFFGVSRVRDVLTVRLYEHGTTIHGGQYLNPAQQDEPLYYYHHGSPIAEVLKFYAPPERPVRVGLVGLGTGALATYISKGQQYTYYELDPNTKWLAADSGFFTYIPNAIKRGNDIKYELGDGRIALQKAPDHGYDILILDAFSSDAIPIHLITHEAFELYRSKLAPHGVIAIHITNRWLRLESVVANTAGHAGFVAWWDQQKSRTRSEFAKPSSDWVICAQNADDLKPLVETTHWKALPYEPNGTYWTDDFSSLYSVLLP